MNIFKYAQISLVTLLTFAPHSLIAIPVEISAEFDSWPSSLNRSVIIRLNSQDPSKGKEVRITAKEGIQGISVDPAFTELTTSSKISFSITSEYMMLFKEIPQQHGVFNGSLEVTRNGVPLKALRLSFKYNGSASPEACEWFTGTLKPTYSN